jgi:DNA topoisomerase VI subunit B
VLRDLSLHILDIVENSIDAGATKIEIMIKEDTKRNILLLKIKDNGIGMDKKTVKKVLDPFYTTKKIRRIGLGLPMLAQATKEAEGSIDIKSKKGKGTTIIAKFVYNHIDRKPFGNMPETIINLIASRGLQIDIIYKHHKNENCFIFDSIDIKKRLQDVMINNPEVLSFLKKEIEKGLKEIEKEG